MAKNERTTVNINPLDSANNTLNGFKYARVRGEADTALNTSSYYKVIFHKQVEG